MYCSAQAGENESVILRVVWNSDFRLHNASNVTVIIASRFLLSITQIIFYFIHQNIVRESHALYWDIYVFLSIFYIPVTENFN